MYNYRPVSIDEAERGAHYLHTVHGATIDALPLSDHDHALLNLAVAADAGNTEAHHAVSVYLRALRGARVEMGLTADVDTLEAA